MYKHTNYTGHTKSFKDTPIVCMEVMMLFMIIYMQCYEFATYIKRLWYSICYIKTVYIMNTYSLVHVFTNTKAPIFIWTLTPPATLLIILPVCDFNSIKPFPNPYTGYMLPQKLSATFTDGPVSHNCRRQLKFFDEFIISHSAAVSEWNQTVNAVDICT